MVSLPDSARKVLEGPNLAHLVTLNADGSPQVSCVWVGLDGDEIVSGHIVWPGVPQRKLDNVRRDPRVVVSLESGTRDPSGLPHYLVVHGTARVQEGGAPELIQQLAYTYLGPDVGDYPPIPNPPAGYVNRITPLRIGGVGPWTQDE
jgi:PPOX class probable F420-dependent enzyme